MTCFSTRISLLLMVLLAVLAAPAAFSQETGTPEEDAADLGVKTSNPIVVELFTAADCSACILADRMIYDAVQDPSVIALSCKVADGSFADTKDGIVEKQGPMDPCIFRQWAYKNNNSARARSISLPQIVINGDEFLVGHTMDRFYRRVDQYHYSGVNKTLEVLTQWKDEDTIKILLPERPYNRNNRTGNSVWIVRYKDLEVHKITSGPNAGRVLRFTNTVQNSAHVGKWHGDARTIEVDVPKPQGGKERGGYVVLVQELMGSPVLAAGKLTDYPLKNDIKREAPKIAPAN